MVLFLPFSGHALTSQTTRNAIQGSAPYLTFDGGRTRAVDTNGLLGITLSDGTRYTPSTNSSSTTPIVLPVAGQSFADIGMFVPTNTNSVDLSTLIGPPNNYWGDDDGDSGVSATGSLSLSIVDKRGLTVSRSTVPTTCNAPYRVTLSSTGGTLSTLYGVPRNRNFSARSETYYVNPKATPMVCFAKPELRYGGAQYAGPTSIWNPNNGFLSQSTDPSRYGKNFPTTGAQGLYFDLLISGSNQALYWSPVSNSGITATMTNSTATSVRVTLTGPYTFDYGNNPGRIAKPTLPQTFELVGRDSHGNEVVKYGFVLKQWFVKGPWSFFYRAQPWCSSIGGYYVPRARDLTNSSCSGPGTSYWCLGLVGATPRSPGNHYQRRIGASFLAEWGSRGHPRDNISYWTNDSTSTAGRQFGVDHRNGEVYDVSRSVQDTILCVSHLSPYFRP